MESIKQPIKKIKKLEKSLKELRKAIKKMDTSTLEVEITGTFFNDNTSLRDEKQEGFKREIYSELFQEKFLNVNRKYEEFKEFLLQEVRYR